MRLLESQNRYLFKYFAFSDDDLVDAACHPDTQCPEGGTQIACCMDAMTFFLLSSIEYAVVNFVSLGGVKDTGGVLKVAYHDCSDGAFNAYHRAALPALLPYVELVDRFSWWGSQAIMWNVIGGCVPGYSVFLGIFNVIRTTGHAAYPRGRYEEVEHDAKEAVFGHRGLIPWPINANGNLVQGDCMRLNKPVQMTHLIAWNSGDWLKADNFHRCFSALKPRFDSFILTGRLNITDYIDFGSYQTVR